MRGAKSLIPQPRLRATLLLLCLAACGGGLWLWQQQTRPVLTYYRRGLEDAKAGRVQEAVRDFQQGIQADPSYPGSYARLGDLARDGGDDAEAVHNYVSALKLSPNDGVLFLQLARTEFRMGDLPAAADAATHAARLRPDDPDALSLHGQLADKMRDTPAALAALRRAHELRPDNSDDLARLVNLEMANLDTAAAERDLAPWLQAHPNDPGPCYDMAAVYNTKPRTPDNLRVGIAYAQRAQAGLPGDPHPPALLGQLYLDAGRPQDALRTLLAATRAAPEDEGLLHSLIRAYTRTGRPQQAAETAARLRAVTTRHYRIDYLQRVLFFNPAHTSARLELAGLEEKDGQRRRAEGDYILAVRKAPHDARARAALVAFLQRTSRPALAKQAADPEYIP